MFRWVAGAKRPSASRAFLMHPPPFRGPDDVEMKMITVS